MTRRRPLSTLVMLVVALAGAVGPLWAPSGSTSSAGFDDRSWIDCAQRLDHDGSLVRRADKSVPTVRFGGVWVEAFPRWGDAAGSRRAMTPVALTLAGHPPHLQLLMHQRNDLDA